MKSHRHTFAKPIGEYEWFAQPSSKDNDVWVIGKTHITKRGETIFRNEFTKDGALNHIRWMNQTYKEKNG